MTVEIEVTPREGMVRPAGTSAAAHGVQMIRAGLRFCWPIAAVLLLWEASSRLGLMNPVLMPPPSAVVANMVRLLHSENGALPVLLKHTLVSFGRIAVGYGLAAVICTALGLLMGINRSVHAFFDPIITVMMPIPTLAWVPIIILWLGMTDATIIFVIFLAGLFPIIYNSAAGVRGISKKHLWAAELMGASHFKLFFKVLLPGALPSIITGHILAVSNGWRALVGAEMLAGSGWGLGYLIFDARTFMDTETVYGGIVMIALLGLLIEKGLFRPLQRYTIERWGTVRAA
ncbi:ABC transporter permease [Bradyrhizobium sp. CCBAU 51765]|jgi:NitT/TauT family transport system permease protein|uniref:ABC transporter permease n=1 Tax=Bradyrhizobium sp. CCBAU 51765 TaxID=1325102 RepID=UPI0018885D39|nr:ABC transporter permease [Bradyrhizobium sp. CCBAU 51765]QOZ09141.1 ABC transporter permease [Bradyrhizobium sp. CCBAU 51765]